MATVRISRQLLNDVGNKISAMCTSESKGFDKAQMLIDAPMAEKTAMIHEALWGNYAHLEAEMPAHWKVSVKRFDVYFGKPGEVITEATRYNTKMWNPYIDTTPLPVPMGKTGSTMDTHINHDVWIKYPSIAAILLGMKEAEEKQTATTQKYSAVGTQVKQFLKSCASLNDAAKKWPAVMLYVPENYVNEVNRKVVREKKEKEEYTPPPNIDLDALTALAAGHTLGENK